MKNFILLLLVLSCAHTGTTTKNSERKVRIFEAESDDRAALIMSQKLTYLHMTYEQFSHPTLKFQKYSEKCLQENEIGKVVDFPGGTISVSTLHFGQDFIPGLCSDNNGARKGKYVLLYCRKSHKVLQYSCYEEDCGTVKWESEC